MSAFAARLCFALLVGLSASPLSSQEVGQRPEPSPAPVAQQPNTDATYQQLRSIGLSTEAAAASNLVLKRDAGTFTFRSGAFHFLAPVNGKVTGAVFVGDGSFTLTPPLDVEKRNLMLLTKGQPFVEDFSQAVFRFTDGTAEEIKKAAGAAPAGPDGGAAGVLSDVQDALKKKLSYNLHGRILQDVLSPAPGKLFVAFLRGKKFNDKTVYFMDPHGIPDLGNPQTGPYLFGAAPEEVALLTYDANNWGVWAAFHYSHEYASGQASGKQKNWVVDLELHKLDTTLEKSARMRGRATTTFVALANGVRVVPFDLYRTLRVESVTDAAGQPLPFIQEDKDDDPQFFVILPKPLSQGERYSITTSYEGKDAVSNEGGGNYFPIARSNWYPNNANNSVGEYAQYELNFRIPKGMKMAATGLPVREITEGDQTLSDWRSETPLAVGGFNFGRMKRKEAKLEKENYVVEAYANEAQPDWVSSIQAMGSLPAQGTQRMEKRMPTLGTMNTTTMMDKALAEGQLSVMLFTDYFGPAPYKRVAMTQQTSCGFGQAWPGLVYLPLCSFLDSTTRHSLFRGLPPSLVTYFRVVAPHEVAHQWWGHAVGWGGYRDQWMSEGFADLSASIFLQLIQKNDKEFIQFWEEQRRLMIERNRFGFRAIDVGPVTLGYRAINERVGTDIARRLIYPKGAYILHMVRMMMWTPDKGDEAFKNMMRDFVKTYMNQPATTEDFKAMLEKHMTPEMDFDGNRKMDWFFNPYVYGTALPDYKFAHSFAKGADGNTVLTFKVTQSNVDPQFKMLVPVYLELGNGAVVRIGSMPMIGNSSRDAQVPLGPMKDKPKRAVLNYYNDVLCTQEEEK